MMSCRVLHRGVEHSLLRRVSTSNPFAQLRFCMTECIQPGGVALQGGQQPSSLSTSFQAAEEAGAAGLEEVLATPSTSLSP